MVRHGEAVKPIAVEFGEAQDAAEKTAFKQARNMDKKATKILADTWHLLASNVPFVALAVAFASFRVVLIVVHLLGHGRSQFHCFGIFTFE